MNKTQENKVSMYSTVLKDLQNNTSVWESIPAFKTILTQYEEIVNHLTDLARQQQLKPTGASKTKEEKRDSLIDSVIAVAGGLRALATDSGNQELRDNITITSSDLQIARDQDALATANQIAQAATDNLEQLTNYGITSQLVDTLKERIAEFHEAAVQPRLIITNRKNTTQSIEDLIHEVDIILEEKLDMLMEQFKLSQPDFYNKYQNNRMIVDSGIRFEVPETEPTETI
jgi:hypothetical protein